MKKEYASPTYKLLTVFKEGRDKWKEKTIRVKKELKLAKNRILFLEDSKAKFKKQTKELKKTVVQLQSEIADLKSQLHTEEKSNDVKKKT